MTIDSLGALATARMERAYPAGEPAPAPAGRTLAADTETGAAATTVAATAVKEKAPAETSATPSEAPEGPPAPGAEPAPNETTPQTRGSWGVAARPGLADGKLGFPDLERANFGRLRSFRTILDFEFDFLAFVQAAIAAALDGGKVCENIGTADVRSNETVTLVSVEPLNFALLSHFF